MSISSEITRLQEAKEDIIDAIEGKGVTVPTGAHYDDFPDLIDAIPQGGSGNPQALKSVTYTPSEAAIADEVTPDSGYDSIKKVNVSVGAVPSNYVGTSVPRKSSSDLTASGATVTAPAGYYSENATKTIPNATLMLSDAVINLDGSIEAEVKATSGGYVSQGNHYLTVEDVVTMKGAQTYYPSSSDQSISEWQYLTGAQTIKGVTYSGLDAGNIKKDVVVQVGDSADSDRIVSVTGTYEGGGGGGVTWGEIGSTTVTPSVRNLYAKLADSSIEFGSFTLASTPTNAFVDLFTLTSITAPCKGIVIIDDAFYQGASGLPNNGNSEAISYIHFSKAFLNPAKENALASAYPCYGYMIWGVTQTATSAQAGGSIGANPFDGSTGIARGYFRWNGQTLQWKSHYGGQQYTTFVAGRTYRWIAY